MVLRETTFLVGGTLTIALGGALLASLVWAGAGWEFFQAYIGGGVAVGLGVFFVSVARAEGRERRDRLRQYDPDASPNSPDTKPGP